MENTPFSWDDLELPDYQNNEFEVHERIDQIHRRLREANGISPEPKKNSPGFNPTVAQARTVASLAALGLEAKDIAVALDIEVKLLRMFYDRELKASMHIANAAVAKTALAMAMSGAHPDMTRFWLKTRAKWKETHAVEISGPNGDPIAFETSKDKLARALQLELDTRPND